ncbi:MAG TPA: protein kinase [Pirellulales bacterium]|nr:protein kinase [Pirellulales bacterium]
MSALDTKCPPESVLCDFGLGKLDAASAESISQHIEICADCRQRVAGISGDSFVGRLRQADGAAKPPVRRERTYVPGESLANAANSTDGSSVKEDGLPRPSRTLSDAQRDGLGSPSSLAAPPELANHPDYELIKELGQGGMGTVYLAQNRMMDRHEVLKVISKALLDRPGALERFQQEIRSAAKLAHPNIVAAYQVLRLGDLLVFAMEHVAGRDLGQVVKGRGYLPVANAALYVQQVALGLQHAFEKGMVHRDIKPNNLMLAVEGKKHIVKILDFGLARVTSEKDAMPGLTQSGQMLGTPDFIAPEQILDAHKADIRADIYSLGCTLYYLLSGRPPFHATSLYEVLEAHHKREPTPLNLARPDVPMELAAVVAKMMAKQPARRYQTPAEVARALTPFVKPGQSMPAPQPTPVIEQEQPPSPAIASRPLPVQTGPLSAALVPLPVRAIPVAVSSVAARDARAVFDLSTSRWRRPRKSRRRLAAAVVIGMVVVPVLLAGIIFRFKTSDGVVAVEANVEKPNISVDGNRATVTWDEGQRQLVKATLQKAPPAPVKFDVPTTDNAAKPAAAPIATDAREFGPDRRAAEYVLSVGGKVRINGEKNDIRKASNLPAGEFRLTVVHLGGNRRVTQAGLAAFQGTKHLLDINVDNRCSGITDASLANFEDNKGLKSLNLWHARISAAGLRHFKDCSALQWIALGGWIKDKDMIFFKEFLGLSNLIMLQLHRTSVGDTGLANLRGADNLRQINLDGTKVTDAGLRIFEKHQKVTWMTLPDTAIGDAGLAWLRECRGLRGLNVSRTKVTAAGVESLKRALPECKITWDGGVLP